MRDKVILGVTLSLVLLVTLLIYGLVDTNRGPTTALADRERAVEDGKHVFAQYCIQCHGPLGEGCIGPALSRKNCTPAQPMASTTPRTVGLPGGRWGLAVKR